MDPVRHLLVWLGVGAGHVALVVSLWGPGLGPSEGPGAGDLAVVWVVPEPAPISVPVAVASQVAPVETPRPATVTAPRRATGPSAASVALATPAAGEPTVVAGTPPSFAERVEPLYPRGARLAGVEGSVRLRLEVGADGALRGAAILVSSGDAALDRAAVAAAAASTYRPARVGGRAVDAVVEASYRFELR